MTSSQQTWRDAILSDRAQHAYWLENARPSESRRRLLRSRLARTPPPAFPFLRITMSKSRSKARPRATVPNPQWKQIPHLESTTAADAPSRTQVLLRFCPRIARPRMVPQEVGTTRAKASFKERPLPCQGVGNRDPRLTLFRAIVTLRPHSCPNAPPLSNFVNGGVTTQGIGVVHGNLPRGKPKDRRPRNRA